MVFNPIAKRVERLRIRQSDLAGIAKIHKNTVARVLSDEPNVLTSTQKKVDQAVTAEELSLRDYLLDLHPVPAPEAQ